MVKLLRERATARAGVGGMSLLTRQWRADQPRTPPRLVSAATAFLTRETTRSGTPCFARDGGGGGGILSGCLAGTLFRGGGAGILSGARDERCWGARIG